MAASIAPSTGSSHAREWPEHLTLNAASDYTASLGLRVSRERLKSLMIAGVLTVTLFAGKPFLSRDELARIINERKRGAGLT